MRKFKTLLMAITTVAALSSCSKEDNNNSNQGGNQSSTNGNAEVSLQFDNYVGTEKLALGASASAAKAYTSNRQTLKFSEVKYVITNVVLVKADGTKVP